MFIIYYSGKLVDSLVIVGQRLALWDSGWPYGTMTDLVGIVAGIVGQWLALWDSG